MILAPDRPEAAAVACEDLAALLERGGAPTAAQVGHVVDVLCWVPLTHCERDPIDRVLEMSRAVQAGTATPAELRAMAAALRAGVPAMLRTGWTATCHQEADDGS